MNATPTVAATQSYSDAIAAWATRAEEKSREAKLLPADFAELRELAASPRSLRQRLMYLHTASPSPRSRVMAMDKLDPYPGGGDIELTPEPVFPYASVWDAMVDGWQVIQFPEYRATVQDHEIDIQGYQFILQKFEVYCD